MKPTIMCKLTPDAVALLDLIQAKSIGYEEMGELVAIQRSPKFFGNGHAPTAAEVRRKLRADAGRTTINGITVRSWRKGSKNMSAKAVLTTGQDAPTKKVNGHLLDAFKVVQGEMTRNDALGLPTVTREVATKALVKKAGAGKSKGYVSGLISYLFKYGYLREVVGKTPAAAEAVAASA